MTERDCLANKLIANLPASVRDTFTAEGMVVELVKGRDLAIAGQPIEHCWFPLSGMASVIAADAKGREAEVGVVGCDGMVNSASILGGDISEMRILVQLGGTALRVDRLHVRRVVESSSAALKLFLSYDHALSIQAAYSALAYARYTIRMRLARWLLMCADRVGDRPIDLTHEALSIMLGVRRAGVTTSLHDLAKQGAISIQRGGMTILDRSLLISVAGSGYGASEDAYRRLITNAPVLANR